MIFHSKAEARVWPGDTSPGVAATGIAASAAFWEERPPPVPKIASLGAFYHSSPAVSLWLGILSGVAYYIGAKIGFALTFKPHPVAVLWPPNSILMAALLLTPRRMWWVSLVAVLPAHWLVQAQSGVPASMIWCWYISNSCEALIGAGAVRYFLRRPVRFDRLRNVGIFCIFAVFLAPFLSSFLDAGFVVLNGIGGGGYWEIWRIRFTSNVLAALTITPFLVIWVGRIPDLVRSGSRRRYAEAFGLATALLVVSISVFNSVADYDPALLYAPLPFLLWAAVRFGERGASASIAVLTVVAIWGAAHSHGPFVEGSPEQTALYVQVFLIFMAVPLHFLAALIEERDKTEQTLRERDERVGLAAETANLALWTVDFENRQSWMSDKGRALFGFGRDEVFSRESFLARVHPEDREKVDGSIEKARSGSDGFGIEYRLLRPDGGIRSLVAHGRYLRNDRGQITELIGVAADVTSQINAGRELRLQREEITRLNRFATVGEMAASLAHELNQPLAAIISNAHAGMRFIDKGAGRPDSIREILVDVAEDAQRANDIIRNVRNAIRKDNSNRKRLDTNRIIKTVVDMVRPDVAADLSRIETDLEENLPAVEGDPTQIQQVLINLVNNAFEAMRDIPIDRRIVEIVTERDGGGAIKISVRDHGPGVEAENRERVFEQFFTTKEEGLGMGLAIVRSIIEAHGGSIFTDNVDGGGARFSFVLPIANGSST